MAKEEGKDGSRNGMKEIMKKMRNYKQKDGSKEESMTRQGNKPRCNTEKNKKNGETGEGQQNNNPDQELKK